MQFNFTAPVFSLTEDNESVIATARVNFRDASQFVGASDPNGFWNCNRCPNDDNYCQPYIEGDKIYFQLAYIPFTVGYLYIPPITYWIVVNGTPIQVQNGVNGITIQIGTGVEDLVNYINVQIDTSDSFFNDKECWYFQIALPSCEIAFDGTGRPITPISVADCFTAKFTGLNLQAAGDECAYLYCSDKYNTEFYCKVKCEEPTILIQGTYTKGYDCNFNYYGYIDDGFNFSQTLFKPSYRIRGVVEPAGFEFEETRNKTNKIKSKQRESFTLFSQKIPYYVVQQLSSCWNSSKLEVDSITYIGANKLSKNFDEGLMWILKETLFIDCDEINYTCD